MKKNYDIYDDDFNELSGNYKDLVNQPTMGDAFAEAFSKAGSNPAPGPQSAIANAILNGMSAGFKGSENVIRQQKLEPLYKMVAENTARAAEIRAQVQEAKQNELAFKKFADIATPTVAAWAEQVKNGDPRSNITFTGLIDQLSRTVPQFNKYTADHWNTAKGFGLLLNKETGEHLKISADEIMQAIAPRAKEIYGDRWFEKFDGLSAGLAKDAAYALNMQRQEDALGLQGKRADVNLKQAHAGVYQQQANQIQNEIANPPMSDMDKFNYQETRKSNETFLKNLTEDVEKKDPDTKIKVLDKLENIIGSGAAGIGNTPLARMQRWTKENFGKDADIQEAKMLQKYFFPDIKGVAGNPNQKEWSDLVTRIISGEQNVDAALEMIKFEKEQANALKNKYNNYRKAIIDSGNRLPYYHPEITSRVEQTVSNPATSQTGSGNQNLPSDEELGIKFY